MKIRLNYNSMLINGKKAYTERYNRAHPMPSQCILLDILSIGGCIRIYPDMNELLEILS